MQHQNLECKRSEASHYILRGCEFVDLKDYDSAIYYFNQAILLEPGFIDAYEYRAIAYFKLGKYDLVIKDCSTVLELSSGVKVEINRKAETYHNRGMAYLSQSIYQLALDDFNQAIKLNPNYMDAKCNRQTVLMHFKKYKLVIWHYEEILKVKPDYVLGYLNRGLAHLELKEYALANKNFLKVIELKPESINARCGMVDMLLELNRYAEAKKILETVVISHRDNVHILERLGNVSRKLMEYNLAVICYSKLLKDNLRVELSVTACAQIYNNRGCSYLAIKKYDLAINDFSEAIKLKPNHATWYVNRAMVYSVANKPALALNDLVHATRLDVRHNEDSFFKEMIKKYNKSSILSFINTFTIVGQVDALTQCLNEETVIGKKFASSNSEDETLLRIKRNLSDIKAKMAIGTYLLAISFPELSPLPKEVFFLISLSFLQLAGVVFHDSQYKLSESQMTLFFPAKQPQPVGYINSKENMCIMQASF